MCGIAGILSLSGHPGARPAAQARGHERPDRASRPRRRGHLGARARPRRLRPPPPEHHRPRARPPADDRRGRQRHHLQRRDLQLPRGPRRARRRALPHRLRHRGRAARPTDAGAPLARPPARHVRLRDLGRAQRASSSARATASASSRSYYAVVDGVLYFASEAKALMPFLPRDRDRPRGAEGLPRLPVLPRRQDAVRGRPRAAARPPPDGARTAPCASERYWEVYYELDWDHTSRWFQEQIEELLHESVRLHLRSDVPVGGLPVSGGLDSSSVAAVASLYDGGEPMKAFTGKFSEDDRLRREPVRARRSPTRAASTSTRSTSASRTSSARSRRRLPPGLPGRRARAPSRSTWSRRRPAAHCKVILGGQGGDEVFGGYTRYLIAYFEQCIKAAIDGTMHNGNFVVTYESIIPNLGGAGELQAAAAALLARGAVRGPRRALLPPHQPRPRPGGDRRLRGARRLRAVRELPGDLQRHATWATSPTSTR